MPLSALARIAALRVVQGGRRVRDFVTRRNPVEIAAYRGYGSAKRAYVHGRVLERPGYGKPAANDPVWRNLLNTYRRANTNPVAFADVRARVGAASRFAKADDEGFFSLWVELPEGEVLDTGWVDARLELISPAFGAQPEIAAEAKLLVPPPTARFGIISDIDDTVIQSRVTSFIHAARTVMLGNALTRLPFAGVAKFYTALAAGAMGDEQNPLFYVSSSPWNIYDVIEDFLKVQGIPDGPLLLRDWDVTPGALGPERHHSHKGDAIREIMETYPALPFILIGDSSQQDPDIYHRVVHDFPERVLGVYIRDVVRTQRRTEGITALAREVADAGSALVLAEETATAAADAAQRGWIAADAIEPVVKEAAADAGATAEKAPAPA